jgi:hypothetical protein
MFVFVLLLRAVCHGVRVGLEQGKWLCVRWKSDVDGRNDCSFDWRGVRI